jgi:hypothetical protein
MLHVFSTNRVKLAARKKPTYNLRREINRRDTDTSKILFVCLFDLIERKYTRKSHVPAFYERFTSSSYSTPEFTRDQYLATCIWLSGLLVITSWSVTNLDAPTVPMRDLAGPAPYLPSRRPCRGPWQDKKSRIHRKEIGETAALLSSRVERECTFPSAAPFSSKKKSAALSVRVVLSWQKSTGKWGCFVPTWAQLVIRRLC